MLLELYTVTQTKLGLTGRAAGYEPSMGCRHAVGRAAEHRVLSVCRHPYHCFQNLRRCTPSPEVSAYYGQSRRASGPISLSASRPVSPCAAVALHGNFGQAWTGWFNFFFFFLSQFPLLHTFLPSLPCAVEALHGNSDPARQIGFATVMSQGVGRS